MNLKLIVFCFLICTVLLSCGCTKQLSSEEIQTKLIQANSNLDSYTIDVNMSLKAIEPILIPNNPQFELMEYNSASKVLVDSKNEEMSCKRKVQLLDRMPDETPEEIDSELYFIDGVSYGYVYSYAYDKDQYFRSESDSVVGMQEDKMRQLIKLIQKGTIEVLKEDSFGGNSYYVIRLTPNPNRVIEDYEIEDMSYYLPIRDINSKDVVKSDSSIIWVNKKTFVIEKSRRKLKITEPHKNVEITLVPEITLVTRMQISDVNKPVKIILPEEMRNVFNMTDTQKP